MDTGLRVKEYDFNRAREKTRRYEEKKSGGLYRVLWNKAIIASFYIVLFGMLGLRIALPAPTISEAENRELKKMPPVNAQHIFLGDFTKEYEDYFADTFPLRDPLIASGDYVSYIFTMPIQGVDTVIVANENVMQTDEDFESEGFDPPAPGGPDTGVGESAGPGTSGTDAPSATDLTEPSGPPDGADSHVAGSGPAEDAESSGRYLMTDTAIYYQVRIHSDIYTKWANAVNRLAQALPDTRIAVLTPPNSCAFYAPEQYDDPNCDQQQGISDVYALIDSSVIKVNPYPYLEADMGEYIYFRTDHHWTARGAYCGYNAFCDAMGLAPISLSSMQKNIYEKDFLGSYYKELRDTPKAKLIRNLPDYIEYFVPPAQCQLTMYTKTSLSGGRNIPMFDMDLPSGTTNYYRIFLGGDYPCIKIETDTRNGQSILILKDSYANSFAPFLTANYETIYIVDFRDFNGTDKPTFKLAQFVQSNGVDDVLLLLNFDFVNSSTYVNWYLRALP